MVLESQRDIQGGILSKSGAMSTRFSVDSRITINPFPETVTVTVTVFHPMRDSDTQQGPRVPYLDGRTVYARDNTICNHALGR